MKLFLFIVLLTVTLTAQDNDKLVIANLQRQVQILEQQIKQTQQQPGIRKFIDERIKVGKKELEAICKSNGANWIVTFSVINNTTVINNGCVGK